MRKNKKNGKREQKQVRTSLRILFSLFFSFSLFSFFFFLPPDHGQTATLGYGRRRRERDRTIRKGTNSEVGEAPHACFFFFKKERKKKLSFFLERKKKKLDLDWKETKTFFFHLRRAGIPRRVGFRSQWGR